MTAHFPAYDTVHTAMALANRAPSVHNSQPWNWRVGSESLHLYARREMHLPYTDPDSRDLLISCGAALNHCSVAFAALGWQAKIHRLPNSADPGHLASVQLNRHAPAEVDIALAAAIPRRRTDRRRYSSWPVSLGDIALIGSRAARMGVTLRRVETTAAFGDIIARAMSQHAADADYLTELTAWSGRHASTTGVPARNTPPPDPGAAIPGRVFSATALAQPADTDPAEDSGVLLALGTDADDDVARLRAGEATSLVLLSATAAGLASCPVTEPLEISETRAAVRSEVFADECFPQMLLRVGWAAVDSEPLPATSRRPLSDVVRWLGGTPFEPYEQPGGTLFDRSGGTSSER